MKIVSFYTEPEPDSNYYTKHGERLAKECEYFGLDYHIEELESRGDYWLNCQMKPNFILSCIEKFGMPLVWLDVDTKIDKVPNLEDLGQIDLGAFNFINGNLLMHSYCLYFNGESSIDLLKDWKARTENPIKITPHHRGDHFNLIDTINEGNYNWKYMEEFCSVSYTPGRLIKSKC
jgi:hypothetical protein